jgi:hypothetical protein
MPRAAHRHPARTAICRLALEQKDSDVRMATRSTLRQRLRSNLAVSWDPLLWAGAPRRAIQAFIAVIALPRDRPDLLIDIPYGWLDPRIRIKT